MDNIRIQTTQNVDIEYEPAGLGERILASLLDLLFIFGYIMLAFFLIGFLLVAQLHMRSGIYYLYFLFFLPVVFYDLACETFFEGRSFGKMILKIKVVKLDGSRAGFGAYLIRWLLRLIDISLASGAVAIIAIVASEKSQRLGDMAAGTTVIRMKQRVQLSDTILSRREASPGYTIVFPEVARLSDNDISIIKEVMLVSVRTGNMEAIALLAAKTRAAMGINTVMPPSQFLYTVVQDYTHYAFEK